MAIAGTVLTGFFELTRDNKNREKAVRFLARDGRLVEVDRNKIPAGRAKATSEQVASWIWKDQKL